MTYKVKALSIERFRTEKNEKNISEDVVKRRRYS